jgi:hypothetical protein
MAGIRMGGLASDRNLLALELDHEGRNGLSVFSTMVGVCARRGCASGDKEGQFDLDSIAKKLRAAVCGFFPRMVAV